VNIYAFDVDDTLDISNGPVIVAALRELAAEHIVGICGNWALFIQRVPDWHHIVGFVGPMLMTKADFLRQLRVYVLADRYVMVGNAGPDDTAAHDAGWEFISEQEFAHE
jgi:hypothetical protein